MLEISFLQKVILFGIPILFAITVHEVAHGWVASKLGDPTAKILGRITLNPIKHIDPIGTIIVPIILLFIGGFIFGWAKPVPVTWQNLKHPKRDMALVAFAGPLANLLMALIWASLLKLGIVLKDHGMVSAITLGMMSEAGVAINLTLMVLNLIPLPPLDGSRVLSAFLRGKISYYFSRIEPYSFLILIILLGTGILSFILGPIVEWVQIFFYNLFAL
jgi:Zn-dependent protease